MSFFSKNFKNDSSFKKIEYNKYIETGEYDETCEAKKRYYYFLADASFFICFSWISMFCLVDWKPGQGFGAQKSVGM